MHRARSVRGVRPSGRWAVAAIVARLSLHIEYEKKASVEEHMRFLARDRKALAAALARR